MTFLESVVVGAIGGAIGGMAVLWQLRHQRAKLAEAIRAGDRGRARAYVDKIYPRRAKLGVFDVPKLINRYAALGALGDVAALREEPAALKGGGATARVQALGQALFVRKMLGDRDPALVAGLEALVAEADKTGVLPPVKNIARVRAALARAADGVPLDDDVRRRAETMAGRADEPARAAMLVGLMHDRIARKDTVGLAEMNLRIERDWPASAWAERAQFLLKNA